MIDDGVHGELRASDVTVLTQAPTIVLTDPDPLNFASTDTSIAQVTTGGLEFIGTAQLDEIGVSLTVNSTELLLNENTTPPEHFDGSTYSLRFRVTGDEEDRVIPNAITLASNTAPELNTIYYNEIATATPVFQAHIGGDFSFTNPRLVSSGADELA